jgi:hypothetical protein
VFQFRRVVLAGAGGAVATAALIVVAPDEAFASSGCDAINLLGVVHSGASPTPGGAFSKGDTITWFVPAVGSGNNTSAMYDTLGLYSMFQVTPSTFTYTYVTDVASDQWNFENFSNVDAPLKCTPATNTDGQNIRSLQNSITTIVVTTSGQAITNAIAGGIHDAFSPNGTPTNFGPNGGFINFATPEPKSQIASHADEAFAAFAYAGGINKSPNDKKMPALLDRAWSAWADIRGTGWDVNGTNGTTNDLKGNQINITAGIGHKLTPDTLVGIVAGYENFKYDVASLSGSLKGDGETIGGYFAQRFGGSLRFDAAAAWSNVNYSAAAGSASGSFTGRRWLASTGLTGTYKVNAYVVEPSAKVYALWESEKAWTDSLGTLQPSRNFSAGRAALGAKVSHTFQLSNGWTLTPNAGLYGDWRFQTDSALPTATPVANIGTGWSGRVTGGVTATADSGCTISLDGEYGGLGATYKLWSGNLRASVPF